MVHKYKSEIFGNLSPEALEEFLAWFMLWRIWLQNINSFIYFKNWNTLWLVYRQARRIDITYLGKEMQPSHPMINVQFSPWWFLNDFFFFFTLKSCFSEFVTSVESVLPALSIIDQVHIAKSDAFLHLHVLPKCSAVDHISHCGYRQ